MPLGGAPPSSAAVLIPGLGTELACSQLLCVGLVTHGAVSLGNA